MRGFDHRIQCRVLAVRFSHWYFLETMQLIKMKLIIVKNKNTWTKLLQEHLWSNLYLEITHVKPAINAEGQHIRKTLKSNVSITKHLIILVLVRFHSSFHITPFQATVSVFKIALPQIWPKLNHTNKTPRNLYVADITAFQNNCTILMLYIITNHEHYTQLAFNNVTVCMVSPLYSKNRLRLTLLFLK